MADWGRLVPGDAPKSVEAARSKLEVLKARVPAQRDALESAKRAVIEAERLDRERMAAQLARGAEAEPDDDAIAKARERVVGVERAGQALLLAIGNAELALAQAARDARAEWFKTSERRETEARRKGRDALERLRVELENLRLARSTMRWLTPESGGLDREQQPILGGLGSSPSSARMMANAEATDAATLLGWVAEVLDPPVERGPGLIPVAPPLVAAG